MSGLNRFLNANVILGTFNKDIVKVWAFSKYCENFREIPLTNLIVVVWLWHSGRVFT